MCSHPIFKKAKAFEILPTQLWEGTASQRPVLCLAHACPSSSLLFSPALGHSNDDFGSCPWERNSYANGFCEPGQGLCHSQQLCRGALCARGPGALPLAMENVAADASRGSWFSSVSTLHLLTIHSSTFPSSHQQECHFLFVPGLFCYCLGLS